jgi:hypothetical protein
LDDALIQVSNRIGAVSTPDSEKKFRDYVLWMKQWMPAGERFYDKPVFWYYLDTIGGAAFGALFAFYASFHSPNLWWGISRYVGYTGGAIIFVTMGSIKAVRRYCKTFISSELILALNPDKVGGLRPLGQFSLGLDISFALATLVIFSCLVQGVSISDLIVVVTLLLYTLLLVVVFFIPLSAAHDSMLEAKERAYNQTHEMFRDVHSKIFLDDKKPNFKRIEALKNVFFLYEKVSRMSVWPLNLGIILRFIATSSFPIVGSLIVAYITTLF